MSSASQTHFSMHDAVGTMCGEGQHWYAVQTRARHEKTVEAMLKRKGITSFVPSAPTVRRWSDRRAIIDTPLFPCYAFVQGYLSSGVRLAVLQTPGVLRFVGFNEGPVAIPDCQIEAIQTMLAAKVACSSYQSIRIGERVRVRGGALDGVEGMLTGRKGERKLVVTVELIQQSIAVVVEGLDVERV